MTNRGPRAAPAPHPTKPRQEEGVTFVGGLSGRWGEFGREPVVSEVGVGEPFRCGQLVDQVLHFAGIVGDPGGESALRATGRWRGDITHHTGVREALLVPRSSMLDVPHDLVERVSWLIYARWPESNSPWRRPGCFKHTLLVLAHLRKNETYRQVGAGFGVSEATAWRYADETLALLAVWAPGIHDALVGLGGGGFVIARGTPIPVDRIGADEPCCSQKPKRHGMNVQVVATPDGAPLWFSRLTPGRARDLTATRAHGTIRPDPADPHPRRLRLPRRRLNRQHPLQEAPRTPQALPAVQSRPRPNPRLRPTRPHPTRAMPGHPPSTLLNQPLGTIIQAPQALLACGIGE